MSFFVLAVAVAVTLTKSDWSGEQVKVQKRLKKLVLHAGQAEMIDSALFKLVLRASICSSVSAGLLGVRQPCTNLIQIATDIFVFPLIAT